jgi:hypothetical protein
MSTGAFGGRAKGSFASIKMVSRPSILPNRLAISFIRVHASNTKYTPTPRPRAFPPFHNRHQMARPLGQSNKQGYTSSLTTR